MPVLRAAKIAQFDCNRRNEQQKCCWNKSVQWCRVGYSFGDASAIDDAGLALRVKIEDVRFTDGYSGDRAVSPGFLILT
jgi:hypothetical protein